MDINLKLEEYYISKEDLAYMISVNVLKQLGLELKDKNVVKIVDEELFESNLTDVLDGTVLKVNNIDNNEINYTNSKWEFEVVTNEIRIIQEDFPTGEAPLNVLLVNLNDKYNMIEEKVNQIIKILLKRGVIYNSNKDSFKVVD